MNSEFYGDNDPVNHPAHYKSRSGLESIDVIEAFTEDISGIEAFCIGNAIKYILRYRKKGKPVQDLEKAKWYIDKAISSIEKGE